jgi:V/A-type H+-transporting ATPase subunit A
VLESTALIKEAVLQQSAIDEVDSYCSPQKQFKLLDMVLRFHEIGAELIELGVPVEQLQQLDVIPRMKRLKSSYRSDQLEQIDEFARRMVEQIKALGSEYTKPVEMT